MEHLIDYIKYFFMSMVPVWELRGSLIAAIGAEGLNPVISYFVCAIGNCVPVPFLILFVRPVFEWMKNSSDWIQNKLDGFDEKTADIDPIPLYIRIARPILKFLFGPAKWLRKIVDKLESKAHDKAAQVKKYEMLGLFIFVAIPLPGTGAWTGSLIAAVLGMRVKDSVPMICLGVFAAGLIMTLGSTGIRMLGEWLVTLF